MSNENIVLARNTERAPKHPLAAQTVAFSHYNHLSAQLPIEPTSGQLVEGGIRAQATQCLKNIQAWKHWQRLRWQTLRRSSVPVDLAKVRREISVPV